MGVATLKGLSRLEELDLSRNRLATLEAGAFDGLPSLTSLDLSDHRLPSLEAGTFQSLSSLTSLDLSINELTSLEAGMFGDLTRLDMLRLHSNPLTRIDGSVFAHPVNLEKLDLPPSTAVPASSLSEEWACSADSRVSTCSVRTEAQRGTLVPTPYPDLTEAPGDELRSDKGPAAPLATDVKLMELVPGNSALAFDLHKALGAIEGNLFHSPYSISLALPMTYAGARGRGSCEVAPGCCRSPCCSARPLR